MKRTGIRRSTKRIRRIKQLTTSSIKQDYIEKTLGYIRDIKRIETGGKCEICGKHEDSLPFPLCLSHILRRSKHQKLILYKPNLLLKCWSNIRHLPYCHNIWHHFDKDEPKYKELVKRIELVVGMPLEEYKEKLKIAEVTLPRMSLFQIECYHYIYKQEYERLTKKERHK